MPQIGWLEILIIVSIAIIVIGPKDFPVMLKKVGSWIGSAKRYFSNIQSEITSLETEDLTAEKKENNNLEIIGINYKDKNKNAQNFIESYGNPYSKILLDKDGTIAIEWGAYGVPETFFISWSSLDSIPSRSITPRAIS